MIPEQDPYRHPPGWKSAFKQLLIWSINFLSFIGLLLIAYGVTLYFTGEKYRFLENAAEAISVVATLVGTGMTAGSVWLPENDRPPDEFSKRISAPIVVISTFFTLFIYFREGIAIPVHVINGFAVLGLEMGRIDWRQASVMTLASHSDAGWKPALPATNQSGPLPDKGWWV
jgi:hypothetical protein